MADKAQRLVCLKTHAALYVEDRLTVLYQIQEMLRVERIFEGDAIEEEMAAYNPLIPDGDNLKATFMLEYDDVEQRRQALSQLRGIEDQVWLQIGSGERIYAVADEDLERSNDDKTSAVHFLRFPLDKAACVAIKAGEAVGIGISHPQFSAEIMPLPAATAAALAADITAA